MIALHYATRKAPVAAVSRAPVKKKKGVAGKKKKTKDIKERWQEKTYESHGYGFPDAFAEPQAAKRASTKKTE